MMDFFYETLKGEGPTSLLVKLSNSTQLYLRLHHYLELSQGSMLTKTVQLLDARW